MKKNANLSTRQIHQLYSNPCSMLEIYETGFW